MAWWKDSCTWQRCAIIGTSSLQQHSRQGASLEAPQHFWSACKTEDLACPHSYMRCITARPSISLDKKNT